MQYGITSTYVENTLTSLWTISKLQDHLHIRGEYCIPLTMPIFYIGSPPHTWRILLSWCVMQRLMRITSTYVENTIYIDCATFSRQDHLHIRGEYLNPKTQSGISLGSPPHTWRIPTYMWLACADLRITSTYVENTIRKYKNVNNIQDHLHIRGEY